MSKKTVYISSTLRDLVEFRQLVIKEFEGGYSESCELNRVMEYMYDDGKSIPNIDVCIEEVKKSNLYLLILGNKIGSFVPNSPKTYTEVEYDTAMEHKERIRIYRFVNTNIIAEQTDNPTKYSEFKARLAGMPIHEFNDLNSFEKKFYKVMSYVVQNPQFDESSRKLYIAMSTIISVIGILVSFVVSYFLHSKGVENILSVSTGMIVCLAFACVVIYILKDIIFPTSNATIKR